MGVIFSVWDEDCILVFMNAAKEYDPDLVLSCALRSCYGCAFQCGYHFYILFVKGMMAAIYI